jgi:hypothetical protein
MDEAVTVKKKELCSKRRVISIVPRGGNGGMR